MTRPALIAFLYEQKKPKIFLRTLLYSTGKKGHIIESMYLKVRRGESAQTFSYWAYAEERITVVGSGLKVGEDGVVYYHHFLPPRAGTEFGFLSGTYEVEIYCVTAHVRIPTRLGSFTLSLTEEHAASLQKGQAVFFEWGPESQTYHVAVDQRQRPAEFDQLLLGLEKFLGAEKGISTEKERP